MAHEKSLAVLPFVSLSGDTETEYFTDGITEEILHPLAALPDRGRTRGGGSLARGATGP